MFEEKEKKKRNGGNSGGDRMKIGFTDISGKGVFLEKTFLATIKRMKKDCDFILISC